MDTSATLQSIAGLLDSLPDETVEDLLVTYDALVSVSDDGARPAAALLLREAAASCAAEARKERLLRAAAAVESSQPCGLTPEGLTAQQAAAAQTVTQEQWEERMARAPLSPAPGEPDVAPSEDGDPDEESEEDADSEEKNRPPLVHRTEATGLQTIHYSLLKDARRSPEYQAFLSSMNISYSQWHDGEGYNLEALQKITTDEREVAVAMLSERLAATPNWRDIEALAIIATPSARNAMRHSMEHDNAATRLRAAVRLSDLGETVDLDGVIIDALRNSELGSGLSEAIDVAEEHPSPRIQSTLLDLALNGHREQRIHCAALALYLGGKADSAFDWEHRPFFLRFGEEDRKTRVEAYRELCRRLGQKPASRG